MKIYSYLLFLSLISITIAEIVAADTTVQFCKEIQKGPMNVDWFYDQKNPYHTANTLHQDRKWKEAENEYEKILNTNNGNDYDKKMAELNLAACQMAQRKASEHWASFDSLIDIAPEKRICKKLIESTHGLYKKIVCVRTDSDGIGDIFHFMETAHILKQSTGCYILFSVRDFLKQTLSSMATAYNFRIIGEKEEQPKFDYETHIIGLLGHLKLHPSQTAPKTVILSASERAMVAITQQINPVLSQGKVLAALFLGENRQATLIGGKQLPRDIKKHGRHLDCEPFNNLLEKYPELVIIHCDKNYVENNNSNQKNRWIKIAEEEEAFDTIIALAHVMNDNRNIIAFAADNGPANVFARTLNFETQQNMAYIIPNGAKDTGEYDMRMEGEGESYTQMISNCLVYKCKTSQDQTQVIQKAYGDLTENI